jgi:hypothetical protein
MPSTSSGGPDTFSIIKARSVMFTFALPSYKRVKACTCVPGHFFAGDLSLILCRLTSFSFPPL